MHRPRRWLAGPAAVAAAMLAGPATAAPPPAIASVDPNAATWYEQAIETYGDLALTDAEQAALDAYDPADPDAAPTPEVRAALARMAPVLELVRTGARQPRSNFRLDYEQGFALELPHLGSLRRLSKLLVTDGATRLHDGDVDGAADALGGACRLAGHLREDRTVISTLVGHAVFRHADSVLAGALEAGTLGPDEGTAMLAALAPLRGPDPFGAVDAIRMERAMVMEDLAARYADGGGAALAELLAWGDEPDFDALVLRAMSPGQVGRGLAEMDDVYARTIAAFTAPDPEQGRLELARIEAEAERGELGPIATLLMPALGRVHEMLLESEATIAERADQLERLAAGEDPMAAQANAADGYLEAIAMLDAIPDLDARCDAMELAASATPEDGARTVAPIVPAVERLAAAAAIRRCSFAAHRHPRHALAWEYQRGMGEALRAVAAVSRAAAPEDVPEHARTTCRMIRHLAEDGHVVSSLVARSGVARLSGTARRGDLAPDARARVAEALVLLAGDDPLGVRAACVKERGEIAEALLELGGLDRVRLRRRHHDALDDRGADELLVLRALVAAALHPGEDDGAWRAAERLERLLGRQWLDLDEVRWQPGAFREPLHAGRLPDIGALPTAWRPSRAAWSAADLAALRRWLAGSP